MKRSGNLTWGFKEAFENHILIYDRINLNAKTPSSSTEEGVFINLMDQSDFWLQPNLVAG